MISILAGLVSLIILIAAILRDIWGSPELRAKSINFPQSRISKLFKILDSYLFDIPIDENLDNMNGDNLKSQRTPIYKFSKAFGNDLLVVKSSKIAQFLDCDVFEISHPPEHYERQRYERKTNLYFIALIFMLIACLAVMFQIQFSPELLLHALMIITIVIYTYSHIKSLYSNYLYYREGGKNKIIIVITYNFLIIQGLWREPVRFNLDASLFFEALTKDSLLILYFKNKEKETSLFEVDISTYKNFISFKELEILSNKLNSIVKNYLSKK